MKTELFNNVADVQADLLVVFVPSEGALPAATAQADEKVNGQITALREQSVFKGSVAQTLLLPSVVEGQPSLLLVGTGKDALSDMNVKKVAAAVGSQIKSLPYATVAVAASALTVKERSADNVVTLLAQWLNEAFYEFLGFKQSDA
ncbi:MAG: M17 family peptidase N-terminal domain-containing protein, partial [Pseudomonadota bacterium]|nr:M17 family peptidase N-terminal domain-containing protein [Pseudomonadota bacterium]